MSDATPFPFSAIVGQRDMKDALLCNAVYPDIGGVLIAGTRGTAKSTAVRSLAHLLPEIEAVADCPYRCPPADPTAQCSQCADRDIDASAIEHQQTPFVDLPIGATEDRVLGSIDVESAIQSGETRFQPGLLARANRGVLYVDEANLLPDHLVDVLLDAVATGTNRVEREGVSVEHPAQVVLVGTMNPEEGPLRPQLLDRFGLYVEMEREMKPEHRKEVVERRAAYEADPEGMYASWADEERALADRIEAARRRYASVTVPDDLVDLIVDMCIEHDVDGLRADIVIHQTARALAALDGEGAASEGHVNRAAELALGHRSRSGSREGRGGPDPGDDAPPAGHGPEEGDKPPADDLPDVEPPAGEEGDEADSEADSSAELQGEPEDGDGAADSDRVFPIAGGREPPAIDADRSSTRELIDDAAGSAHAPTERNRGAYLRARRSTDRPTDIALDATIRAAAPHQRTRGDAGSSLAIQLRQSDLREKHRRGHTRRLLVFVVDASGSMAAYERMSAVKGAILSFLESAYHDRDHVALVGFRQGDAEILLQPTASLDQAARELADLATGGRTPLAAGLDRANRLVARERRQHDDVVPHLVVVTDGRSNVRQSQSTPVEEAIRAADRIAADDIPAVCIDTETGPVRMDIVRTLADHMQAKYYHFDDLDARTVSATVSEVLFGSAVSP